MLELYQEMVQFNAAHPLRKPENASAHQLQEYERLKQEREDLMKTVAASLGLPVPVVGQQSPPGSDSGSPGPQA